MEQPKSGTYLKERWEITGGVIRIYDTDNKIIAIGVHNGDDDWYPITDKADPQRVNTIRGLEDILREQQRGTVAVYGSKVPELQAWCESHQTREQIIDGMGEHMWKQPKTDNATMIGMFRQMAILELIAKTRLPNPEIVTRHGENIKEFEGILARQGDPMIIKSWKPIGQLWHEQGCPTHPDYIACIL